MDSIYEIGSCQLSRQGPSLSRQRQDDCRRSGFDVAAREAYLAVYHAAEAYIVEQTSKAVKTHRDARSQLNRLAQHERIGSEFLTFLAEGYKFKTIADYGIGSATGAISAADATWAIDTADRFIDVIAQLLPS